MSNTDSKTTEPSLNIDTLELQDLGTAQLTEIELLARGKATKSRTLKALGKLETPEHAHALLLKLGHWDEARTPYSDRFGVATTAVELPLPSLDVPVDAPERLDLTHLAAFAIDDEGNQDPDDAISLETLENGLWRLWVHVADVAGLVAPDSDLDLEARSRGATLYLPDATYGMLPDELVAQLGLGLHEISPALSICLDLDQEGNAEAVDVHLTRVKVQRISYNEAQKQLDVGNTMFEQLSKLARASIDIRKEEGAINIDLPEVRVKVENGVPMVSPLPRPHMRTVVQECMTLAGWATAIFADDEEIVLPFATQDPPKHEIDGDGITASWAKRNLLSRTCFQATPAMHSGMGLDLYAQATSPMRRYLDLVVHQQLRAYLQDKPLLSGQDIVARIAQSQHNTVASRKAERQSCKHHSLRYVIAQTGQIWDGIVVNQVGPRANILIPDLALDIMFTGPYNIGDKLRVELVDVNLPTLTLRGIVKP